MAEAASGLRHERLPGDRRRGWHRPWGDSLAGMFAAQGALAALYRRTVTGEGQVVDAAPHRNRVWPSRNPPSRLRRRRRGARPVGHPAGPHRPCRTSTSRDASWVVIAANQDTVFRRLCAAMGQPELAADERVRQSRAAANGTSWTRSSATGQPPAYRRIIDTLSAAGVISARSTPAEVVTDPQLLSRAA